MSKVKTQPARQKLGQSFSLDELLTIPAPRPPVGYTAKWKSWFTEAHKLQPQPELRDTGIDKGDWRIFDLQYNSTNNARIGGWLLLPKSGVVERGMVVGHGYAGRNEPDCNLRFENTALLFLCARGISRSPHGSISNKPYWHVLHDIQSIDNYVLRGCVEDTWLAVSSLLRLFPQVAGRVGYLGNSFGGGIGAMALAWDKRVQRAYFRVPSFGNQPLRMKFKTIGSAYSVQKFERKNPGMARDTLAWYDAAVAAKYVNIPVLCACAKKDPVVTPPGQFAIYNALGGDKELFVLETGHMDVEGKGKERKELEDQLNHFFEDL